MKKISNIYRTIFLMLIFISLIAFATIKAIESVRLNSKETLLLQMHSMYSQNLLRSEDSLGKINCYITEHGEIVNKECLSFYNDFIQNIPVKNYCKSLSDYSCIPFYKVSSKTPTNCEKFYEKLINKKNDSLMLKKNKLMIIAADKRQKYPVFAIDINGMSSPNIIGEDLVLVALRKNDEGKYFIDMNATICSEEK